ncbi:MAG: hypothetical protein CLLPBCKN_003777 [Chroococcidiopsis cubana SAG 39.79]|nr:hypothetical protein [Chroococcidiopsis cubana SAG 39.79]
MSTVTAGDRQSIGNLYVLFNSTRDLHNKSAIEWL